MKKVLILTKDQGLITGIYSKQLQLRCKPELWKGEKYQYKQIGWVGLDIEKGKYKFDIQKEKDEEYDFNLKLYNNFYEAQKLIWHCQVTCVSIDNKENLIIYGKELTTDDIPTNSSVELDIPFKLNDPEYSFNWNIGQIYLEMWITPGTYNAIEGRDDFIFPLNIILQEIEDDNN